MRTTKEQTLARFWARVDKTDDCWIWRGATTRVKGSGYGRIVVAGRTVVAHRFTYEMFVGPVPEGLQIDHVCRTKLCVRPDHLEVVTAQENNRRRSALKTHCPHGHPYDEENTKLYRGGRYCRACQRAKDVIRIAERSEQRRRAREARLVDA